MEGLGKHGVQEESQLVLTSQTEFNTIEKSGGEKVHTLLLAEMPIHTHIQNSHGHTFTGASHNHGWSGSTNTTGSHNHNIYARIDGTSSVVQLDSFSTGDWGRLIPTEYAGDHSHTVSGTNVAATQGGTVGDTTAVNQNAGSDGSHNNLQPYITCYMWKRTG